jgi:hypothetical protein
MKNVITKFGPFKEYGMFNHIYFLDCDYDFNDRTIEELTDFVNKEPFSDILIHSNDLTLDVVRTLKELSKIKEIWFESEYLLFENFAVMEKESLETLGIDKISVMIDSLGDVIDLEKSIQEQKLVKFDYEEAPF